jgi:FTR1 family protein
MLQAFIVTLREGVEAALIVGITLAYLAKIGLPELRKPVCAALISTFVGSIGIAILLSRTHWIQDIFEGWIMLIAAFFVITMIIFMMKTGRALKGQRLMEFAQHRALHRVHVDTSFRSDRAAS